MILESVFNLFAAALKLIFGWIEFPPFPTELRAYVDAMVDLIRMGLNIIWVFIDQEVVMILLPLVVAVINFDHMYKLVMFVLRKIPFLGIK